MFDSFAVSSCAKTREMAVTQSVRSLERMLSKRNTRGCGAWILGLLWRKLSTLFKCLTKEEKSKIQSVCVLPSFAAFGAALLYFPALVRLCSNGQSPRYL